MRRQKTQNLGAFARSAVVEALAFVLFTCMACAPASASSDAKFDEWFAEFWRLACERPIDSGLYVKLAETTITRTVEPTERVWFYRGEWRVNSDYTADGSGFLDMCVRRGLVWSLSSGTLMKADPSRTIPREHDHRLHEEWARMQAWIPATGGLSTWAPERFTLPRATLRDGKWSADAAAVSDSVSDAIHGVSIHVEGEWDAQSGVGTLTRAQWNKSGAPSRSHTLTSARWAPMSGWGKVGATDVEDRSSDGKVLFGIRLIESSIIDPDAFDALMTPPSEGVPDRVRANTVVTLTLDFTHADPVVIKSSP
ncbi:MAG TPA: hypothetical protein PKE29_07820 [Phycisphaerales bacterium]|nr:hypothetical protein [Phycisphaerales bacterium]